MVAANNDYKGTPYYDSTFFKFDAAWVLPWPADFVNTFSTHTVNPNIPDWQYMSIMPIYQTSGIAPNLYGSENNELLSMTSYITGLNQTVGAEVNLKQNPGILTSLYNWGAVGGEGGTIGRALGKFNPYAEFIPPGDDNGDTSKYKYFYSNGYCCAFLSEYFYNGGPNGQPSDTADQRINDQIGVLS